MKGVGESVHESVRLAWKLAPAPIVLTEAAVFSILVRSEGEWSETEESPGKQQ